MVQWAKSSHPLGWKLLSHIPNFRGVKVNPRENFFDTTGVEVAGFHWDPGYLATIGREVLSNRGTVVHNYPYTLYTARFWIKNEPLVCEKYDFFEAVTSSPLETKLIPTPVTSGRV